MHKLLIHDVTLRDGSHAVGHKLTAAQVRAFGQVIASASTVNVELAILLAAVFTVGYTSLVTC